MPQVRVGLHVLEHLITVHFGHRDVEQHQVERPAAQEFECLAAIVGGGEIRIPLARETARQRVSIVLVIVDHEQRGGRIHDASPTGASARILPSRRGSSTGLVS